MKEIALYVIAAISSVVVLGYSVHMFVGGLVSPETETQLITIACSIGTLAVGMLAWDVMRRRK